MCLYFTRIELSLPEECYIQKVNIRKYQLRSKKLRRPLKTRQLVGYSKLSIVIKITV